MVTCNRSCAAGTKNHNNYEDLHTHTGTEGSLITGWDVVPLRPLLPDISIFHIRPPPPFVEIVPRARLLLLASSCPAVTLVLTLPTDTRIWHWHLRRMPECAAGLSTASTDTHYRGARLVGRGTCAFCNRPHTNR